MYIFYVEGVS